MLADVRQLSTLDLLTNASLVHQNDDLAKLSVLNETILLENLKQRYDNDLIYVRLTLTCSLKIEFLFFKCILDISRRYFSRSKSIQ